MNLLAEEESAFYQIDAQRILQSGPRSKSHLQYTKEVNVRSSIQKRIYDRCCHNNDGVWKPELMELEDNLMPLFNELKDDSLREFR
jgi:hypothetical protein